MTQKIHSLGNRYGSGGQPALREPVLVDSWDEAKEIQEKEVADKVTALIDDFTSIFAKMDKIVSNIDLFRATDKYFVNSKEWLELQDNIANMDTGGMELTRSSLWDMEQKVTQYQCESFLKNSNHLGHEIEKLNGALETISHVLSHLIVMREGLDGVAFVTQEPDYNEAPF